MKKKTPIELSVFIDYTNKIARTGRPILVKVKEHYGDEIELKIRFNSKKPKNKEFKISSRAALAAELQGKLMEMHDLLVFFDGQYTEKAVFNLADSLELDMQKFEIDFHSEIVQHRLEDDMALAKQRGIKFIPGISINGHRYNGAWDEHALIEAIDSPNTYQVSQAMQSFVNWGASAAMVLLIAAIGALVFANIGFIEEYEFLRHFQLGLNAGDNFFSLPIEAWVNDALMAVFFLLVGLEIKREIISGELSDVKKAAMPVIGALGGMLVPAIIYLLINLNSEGAHGWGVPMATDIAFTLGLMALLGSKVPGSLKVFISALAVTDDLGAILVIAVFYGHGFHIAPFIVSLLIISVMFMFNYYKVYSKTIYIVLGIFLWFFIFQSGLHATLAGVITAILIPARRKGNIEGIATQAMVIFQHEIVTIRDSDNSQESIRHGSLKLIQKAINRLIGPAEQIEYSLERTVNYSILPLFAFFNTGILIVGMHFNVFTAVNMGIIAGLCIGKPLGIVGFCWIASKLGFASLSKDISWFKLIGAAFLAGVGFTMSLVVAATAFEGDVLDGAKLSILLASALSAIIGLVILKKSIHIN